MDWSALPYELEETILCCLSLRTLADVSSTCKRFDQVFRQELAKEQKARCDLAFSQFGRKRVARIADIAHSFLNTQLLGSPSRERVKCYWSTAEDGTLQVAEALPPGRDARQHGYYWWSISEDGRLHAKEALQPGMIANIPPDTEGGRVQVILDSRCAMLVFSVSARNESCVSIMFARGPNVVLSSHDRFCFSVTPGDDEDVAGVALVQALLSGEFAPVVGEGGPHSDVQIQWGSCNQGFTSAGLAAQIGPLLPLMKSYRIRHADRMGEGMVRERREGGEVPLSARRSVKLHVWS
jgi:hypothetical protein